MESYLIKWILAVILLAFSIYLIWAFWNISNYEGRLQCKFAYVISAPFVWLLDEATNTISAAQNMATLGVVIATSTVAAIAVGKASWGKISKRILGKADDVARAAEKTASKIDDLAKSGKLSRYLRNPILKRAATLGILSGLSGWGLEKLKEYITEVARPVIYSMLQMCDCMVYGISEKELEVDCKEMSNYIMKNAWEAMENEFGKCDPNNDIWKQLYIDFLIAKSSRDAFGEMLYGMGKGTGIPWTHYAFYIINISDTHNFTEEDIVCWWAILKSSKSGLSFFKKVYGKSKEYIASQDLPNGYCKQVLYLMGDVPFNYITYSSDEGLDLIETSGYMSGSKDRTYLILIYGTGNGGLAISFIPENESVFDEMYKGENTENSFLDNSG